MAAMNSEKVKVPLCENGRVYADRDRPKSCARFFYSLAGGLLFILIISLFVNSMIISNRVKILENEIGNLKKALVKIRILDDDLIGQIIGFENDDNIYEDEAVEEPQIFLSKDDTENEYVEYDNYDQNLNETQDTPTENESTTPIDDYNDAKDNKYRSASDLTKDFRDETSKRARRNVIGATNDGVLINEESYIEKKNRANTAKQYTYRDVSVTMLPAQASEFGSPMPHHPGRYASGERVHITKPPPVVYTRQSRVMHHEDKSKAFRQLVKKSALLKSGGSFYESNEETSTPSPDFTIVRDENIPRRRYRQRNSNMEVLDERHPRVGRIKPLPSIHYGGDTSRYAVGQHSNFNGNGHMRHNQQTYIDWKPSDWVESTGMTSHFNITDGVLTVKEPGLYFVYSQIYYLDEHDMVGYRVYKNADIILQCTVTIYSTGHQRGNTCYTAGVEHLSEGDTISITDLFQGRYTLFEPGKSFFGVIKLGDIRKK